MAKKSISYGALSDFERDADGYVFFGAGNLGTGWHGVQNYAAPGLLPAIAALFRGDFQGVRDALTPSLQDSVAAKVHYRTGDDVLPDNEDGDTYSVDGGYQQAGVHSADGTNVNRASWNVDYSFLDMDDDLEDAYIKVDLDPTARKDFLTFNYDSDLGAFVAIDENGGLRYLDDGNGNGAEPGTVAQDSINLLFFADLIDDDGNASNGRQSWDMEHGQFDFEFGQTIEGPLSFFPLAGTQTLSTSVQVNVGPMIDVLPA